MAIATEQLKAINQEITQAFSDDPRISVVAADGNPPDKYEVTYLVEGLQKNESGAIEKTDRHTIGVSIPFGYPHFPPSCKPKSPIFHPDFDPAAICIGDFWEKNRSIVDLIRHIGEMITGAFYSTTNAFNEEAAQWYAENFSEPSRSDSGAADDSLLDPAGPALAAGSDDDFTSLLGDDEDEALQDDLLESFEPAEGDSVEPALSFVDDEDIGAGASETDSLGDIFQESDFDFEESPQSSPGDDEFLPPGFNSSPGELEIEAALDVEDDLDTDHLRSLADQKRFFGLDKELSMLPADTSFEGKEALAEQAAIALEEAQTLYTQALEFEHKGEPEKALKYFKKIESCTTDYPGLNEDISRMTQALELLGGWTEPKELEEPEIDSEELPPAPTKESAPPPKPPKPGQKPETQPQPATKRTFFEDHDRQKSRLVPYALALVVVLIGAAIGLNYYFSSSKMAQAQQRFEQCRSSLEQNKFTDAELQCESALGLAKQVKLFKSGERDSLIMEVGKTLRSDHLKQGLAGNLLLDGEYYPKQVVSNILAFREFKRKGDDLFNASKWQESVSNYEQALAIADGEDAIDRQELFSISENIKIAQFNIIYQSGISFIERKKWVLATQDLSDALDQLKALSVPNKNELIDNIADRLAEIEQSTEKEKGETAFAENRWNEAASHYRDALAMANKSLSPDENEIYELKQLIVKADLYDIVSAGKSAFRQSRWDEAINNYDKAINLLEDNRELLRQANTEENRKKLARIMLQASVIRDKQDAARHLKEEQYEQAVEKLTAIIDSVSASEFSGEDEFSTVSDEARQSIEKAEKDKLLSDKISYLEDNFQELFTKHYSGSPPESLVEREVVFEKKMDSKLLFRLQCVEVGRGRPLQLVMKYIYDQNSGAWRFYSDSQ